jgi:Ca2+-binding RTX toxin-like protein
MPNLIMGTSKDDALTGTVKDDLIYGLAGNDTIDGGAGNDIISGGGRDSAFNATNLRIGGDFKGSLVLETPAKGSVNPVGMYKIDAAGNIVDVKIVFNGGVSGPKGSGGAPTVTNLDLDLKAGERYGFFILSNGYGTNGNQALLADANAKWELRDESGGSGDVGDKGLRLYHVNPVTGVKTAISTSQGHEIYHSIDGLNPDGVSHAKSTVDYARGIVTIGLESGKGNNPDFADAVIKINIGIDNTLALGEPDPAGNGGDDKLSGGAGDDTILGMAGNDTVSGGSGNDKLWDNTGHDTIHGDDGDDRANGGEGNDTIHGGAGKDKLSGNTGADKVHGDDGDDTINGNDGDDTLGGGTGNDTVYGGKGVDKLAGDAGDDKLYGDTGIDTVSGGEGRDTILGGDGDDALAGDQGEDTINGGKGVDRIADGDGNDKVDGDSGNDTFIAGSGDDIYVGGAGSDTLDFSAFTGIAVDLLKHVASGAGNDKISGVENVIGSAGDDVLTGDSLANQLAGDDGNDLVKGGRGSDILWGGLGADIFVWGSGKDMTGETGTDKFVDTIADFGQGDVLDLRALPDLKAGQTVADLVSLRVEGGDTVVSAAFGSGGAFVDVAVLKGVVGLDVHTLYADGALLV